MTEQMSSLLGKFGEYSQRYPIAVALELVYLAATVGVLLFATPPEPLVAVLGLPLLLLLPGYAVVTALFPRACDAATETARSSSVLDWQGAAARVTLVERAALSFAVSIAVLPLIGVALGVAGIGLGFDAVVGALGGVTAVALLVGAVRRQRLPPEDRFRVPVKGWVETASESVFGADSASVALVNVALAIAVVLAVGAFSYGLVVPRSADTSTTLLVVTGNQTGSYAASDYPENLTRGEPAELTVGVENSEGRTVAYTVVARLQQLDESGDGFAVTDQQQVARFDRSIPAGESWFRSHTVTPELTGERLRLTYLLYKGAPPSEPTVESAAEHAYLWVGVEPETAATGPNATVSSTREGDA
ncbi:DUF1616 domain-containing protein [Halosimplex pelagicum]|uniref:DUF1616 domain-containing protein n=1 Tax=Halosimplex pelagicum TaxID=869886 RepID=A0A7D5T2I9_9EURY|nr:DUF1616 domain-containing protein [Halosimplex pelagicum]QLH81191.1 DUF1616 domain-containing protein [Halosimplex pelagicum]